MLEKVHDIPISSSLLNCLKYYEINYPESSKIFTDRLIMVLFILT